MWLEITVLIGIVQLPFQPRYDDALKTVAWSFSEYLRKLNSLVLQALSVFTKEKIP